MIKIRWTKNGVTVRATGREAARLVDLVGRDLAACGPNANRSLALIWPTEPLKSLPGTPRDKTGTTGAGMAPEALAGAAQD